MTFLLATAFLGFTNHSTLLDVTNRFGSPISVEFTQNQDENEFIYNRDGYIFTIYCDHSAKINHMDAYGLNTAVSYKGIKLTSDFATVVKKMGNPESYTIEENSTTLNYPDASFTLDKVGKQGKYKLVKISVNCIDKVQKDKS